MKYKCKKCGECESRFELQLKTGDLMTDRTAMNIMDAVNRNYGISFKEFNGVAVVVYGTCTAYNKETKRCMIYKNRPVRCRAYYCGRYRHGEKK